MHFFQVKSITFHFVQCSACVKIILDALGPVLNNLCFSFSYISLSHLIPCSKLERLIIGEDCVLIKDEAVETASWISMPFLPVLKSFTSYVCLGEWGLLFESKKTLTELVLNCSHIGIRVIKFTNNLIIIIFGL